MTWTLEQYLTPDPNIREPLPSPPRLRQTAPSRGVRDIRLPNKIGSRGAFFVDGHKTWFESKLEYWVGFVYMARPETRDLISQFACVEYVDDDGEVHEHTFDFLVVRNDGARIALVVKHSSMVAKTGTKRVVELLGEQTSPRVADYVKLVTEKSFTREDRINAALIYAARRRPYPEDDAVLAKLIHKMRGEARVGDLVEATKLDGFGFRAAVRAISYGRLVLIERGVIHDDTVVKRAPRKSR